MGALTNKKNTFRGRPWEFSTVRNPNLWDLYGLQLDCQLRGKNFIRIVPHLLSNDVEDVYLTNKVRFKLVNSLKINRLKQLKVGLPINQLFNFKNDVHISEEASFFKPLDHKNFFSVLFNQINHPTFKGAHKSIFRSNYFGLNSLNIPFNLVDVNLQANRDVDLTNNLDVFPWLPLSNEFNLDQTYLVISDVCRESPIFSLRVKRGPEMFKVIPNDITKFLKGRDRRLSRLPADSKVNIIVTRKYISKTILGLIRKISIYLGDIIRFILLPTVTHLLPSTESKIPHRMTQGQLTFAFDLNYESQINPSNLNILCGLHNPLLKEAKRWSFLLPLDSPLEDRKVETYLKVNGLKVTSSPVVPNKYNSYLDILETFLINFIIYRGDRNLTRLREDTRMSRKPNRYIRSSQFSVQYKRGSVF